MDEWIEVEDSFLSNQPARWRGRSKNRECVPDPDIEPTEFYLICYDCHYTPKRRLVSRRRYTYTLFGSSADELDELLEQFIDHANVVHIESPSNPRQYVGSGLEPVPLSTGDSKL